VSARAVFLKTGLSEYFHSLLRLALSPAVFRSANDMRRSIHFGPWRSNRNRKSTEYQTVSGQNRQGVFWIFCRSSVITLKGNDRRQSVQVTTT
jgi:hypothetical protein